MALPDAVRAARAPPALATDTTRAVVAIYAAGGEARTMVEGGLAVCADLGVDPDLLVATLVGDLGVGR